MNNKNRRKIFESALNTTTVNSNPDEKEKTETKIGVLDNQQPYDEEDIPTTSEFVGLEDLY